MTRPADFLEVPSDIRAPSFTGGARQAPSEVPPKPLKTILNPNYVPPAGASFFFAGDDASVAGPITSTFSGAQAKISIPSGSVGVIRELNFFVNSLLSSSQIAFVVLINGSPTEGYGAIRMPQLTVSAYAYSPNDVYVLVPEGANVQMRVVITDAVTYSLSFSLRGWSYAAELSRGWWG